MIAAGSEGTGSTITDLMGINVDAQTVGANNLGISINETTGGTNRFNRDNSGGITFRMNNIAGSGYDNLTTIGGFDTSANFYINRNTTLGDA